MLQISEHLWDIYDLSHFEANFLSACVGSYKLCHKLTDTFGYVCLHIESNACICPLLANEYAASRRYYFFNTRSLSIVRAPLTIPEMRHAACSVQRSAHKFLMSNDCRARHRQSTLNIRSSSNCCPKQIKTGIDTGTFSKESSWVESRWDETRWVSIWKQSKPIPS